MPVVLTFFFFLVEVDLKSCFGTVRSSAFKEVERTYRKNLKDILPHVVTSLEEDKLCVGVGEKFVHRQ